jgi:hypothetical protein
VTEPTPEMLAELRFGRPDDLPTSDDLGDRMDVILDALKRERREVERLTAENKRLRRIAAADLAPKIRRVPRVSLVEDLHDAPGSIYAIALAPELEPFRVKVGYSGDGVIERLDRFRTVCPTAIIVATYPAAPSDEARLLAALPGRIGRSEVFICGNVEAFLDEIERILDAPTEAG